MAEAYAVNILGAYAHYRWRAFHAPTNKRFNRLKDKDRRQVAKLVTQRRELQF